MSKILSPAGSRESLERAINCGADAVYFGVDSFNARLKADNCTLDSLSEWIDYCHLYGVKAYITLNTSLKQNELGEAREVAKRIYLAKADGIILTDFALINYVKNYLKGMEVFISTQVNTSNIYALKFWERIGVDGIVLSRELSFEDVKFLRAMTDLQLEIFIHGALCVSVSGQCLMSSMADGRSGNRGLCAQPCRQMYTCVNSKNDVINKGYLLSQKDLCSISDIKKYEKIGIDLFKIEGRNRRPSYVGQATKSYYNVLNSLSAPTHEMNKLKKVYNRGDFTRGYAFCNYSQELIYTLHQNHMGLRVGILTEVNMKLRQATAVTENQMKKGDSFKIMRDGVEVANGVLIECTMNEKNDKFSSIIGFSGTCQVGDSLNVTTDSALDEDINETKRKIECNAEFFSDDNCCSLSLSVFDGNANVYIENRLDAIDGNQNLVEDSYYITQLIKTGDTPFIIKEITIESNNKYIKKSIINNLRRQAFAMLEKEVVNYYNKKNSLNSRSELIDDVDGSYDNKSVLMDSKDAVTNRKNTEGRIEPPYNGLNASAKSKNDKKNIALCLSEYCFSEEYKGLKFKELDLENVLYGNEVSHVIFKPYNYTTVENFSKLIRRDWYLELPTSLSKNELFIYEKYFKLNSLVGIVANNVYAIELAIESGLKVILGTGLNVYNFDTVYEYSKICDVEAFIHSIELSYVDMKSYYENSLDICGYVFSEGYVSNMKFTHCPIQLNYNCTCKNCKYEGDLKYIDKLGNQFKIKRVTTTKCRFILYNCVQNSLIGRVKKPMNALIDTTVFDSYDYQKVVSFYCKLNAGQSIDEYTSNNKTTAGFFTKGERGVS